jgi:hypothetical protein
VKAAGGATAPRPWRRWQTRIDTNFASAAYLIETVVCYPSCRAGGTRNLSRLAASIMSSRARRTAVWQFADRNTLLTTKRNRQYIAVFFERFNPNEISRC